MSGKLALTLLLASAVASASAPSHDEPKNLVATAAGAGNFSTLVAAIKAAGLDGALEAQGPLTIFAPTDEAFAKLPEATLQDFLKPQNREKLAALLSYHLVTEDLSHRDLFRRSGVQTVNGQRIELTHASQGILLDGVSIDAADIAAANGTIHGIDAVLMPAWDDLLATAKSVDRLSTFVAAIVAAGLDEMLQDEGPYTIFAPTDAAFASLPGGVLDNLLRPENRDQLRKILKQHVVKGRLHSHIAVKEGRAATLKGTELPLMVKGSKIMVSGARVVTPNVDASNGVIHVIDRVILP